MMQLLPQERIIGAAGKVAQARQVLDESLEYEKQRQAFGSPIGALPAQQVRRYGFMNEYRVGAGVA